MGLMIVQYSFDVKTESKVEKTFTAHFGKILADGGPYRLFAGNDSVTISGWRTGGIRCTECRSIVVQFFTARAMLSAVLALSLIHI